MKCKCGEEFEPMYRNGLLMSKLCIPCLVAKGKTKQKKDWRKKKSEIKEKLKTHSDWLNELQKEINTIVRLIDKGTFCHSTELKLNDKYDAGHVYTTKACPEIRFNLFNIYAQSVYANRYLSGDLSNYLKTIEKVFGKEHREYIEHLKGFYSHINYKNIDIKEKISITKAIIKDLRLSNEIYSNEERLNLRYKFNNIIGIYKANPMYLGNDFFEQTEQDKISNQF